MTLFLTAAYQSGYLILSNAIDKHLGSLKSFGITKQSLKHIFVYMLSVRQLRTRGVIVSSEGTSHR